MADRETHRNWFAYLGAVAFSLVISMSIASPPARAALGGGHSKVRAGERIEGASLVTGFVESVDARLLSIRGHRFDVSRARFVGPDGKPSSAKQVQRGTKVSVRLDGRLVVEVVVYPPMARE